MRWLIWRQHRKQLLFGLVSLVVLAGIFFGTGIPMHQRFEEAGLSECLPETTAATLVLHFVSVGEGDAQGTADSDDALVRVSECAYAARTFYEAHGYVVDVGLLLMLLPILVGMFWGAPLVAREIENGTHRLVWTQGVSRLRWAVSKIGFVVLGVIVMTAIFAAMLNWWIGPVMQTSGQRFAYMFFDIHGIVVFGYVLFALALGIFAGAVTGRLLTAMATTVVGFLGTWPLVMLVLRPRYLPTETQRVSLMGPDFVRWNELHGDWIVSTREPGGRAPACAEGATDCFDTLIMHPARHFWAMQSIEVAIFVALAAGLIAAAIYVIRRRIA